MRRNLYPLLLLGFALAIAVLFDAFVVRMTIIPAVMFLLGERAWGLPRWLDRLLPTVDVEGSALETAEESAEQGTSTATDGEDTDGGTLDQLVTLGDTLEGISPRLEELAGLVPALHAAVEGLSRSVGPLGELAGRLPLTLKRAALPS